MKLPQGYEPHELPADYTGPLFIEGQVQEAIKQAKREALMEALTCTTDEIRRMAEELK